jgi:Protein of unknown function (DUF2973)
MSNIVVLLPVLVFGFMFVVMSFLIGIVFGWFANEYFSPVSSPSLHPEMYDGNGNYINEELIALRFIEEEEEEED